ncbi:2-oxoacid:acceptor oxidoreductase subunit alpha [Runella sp. SP2]|uniref:2-oxoacid:acceptor oxidoreductase subunit alpha n=1 Tax=Runella sp. SP2 TaxID=2268026 RepID=UPI000F091E3E|nr:2-oxoacid:acceptor oxidoreductase subunit alpha [Runella sp. SP2]AYQ36199.1 2-oxoacid:acceptor oxidoreductase subunit alpha [Runella sp. SP2]
MRNLTGINDLVVRFANVNGTGSASANNMFAMSIFRMGIPMTAKNIFPSNIQGLPTWYEVRVSEKGYLGRREGVDVLVCVNPQSMKQDIASVKSGGYFVYDNTKNLHKDFIREDINYIGIPMIGICMRLYQDPRQRQLFKNMIYVGALAALLDIELEVVKGIIADEFAKKPKLIEPNVQAMMEGVKYVQDNYSYPLHVRVERRDLVGDSIVIDGNTACGLGAVYAGATVAGWYPITPSTSLVEAFAKYANKYRLDPETGLKKVAIVQAEDELAAFGMVLGASWNGARAFTATSGPGVSLMNEFLGLAYFAEIPAVLVDVQRGGPSTGMPTRTQQSDLLLAAYASHGDTKHVLLLPSTPTECFNLMADAFDLAERLQTPVIMMTDLDLGMNDHLTAPLKWDDSRRYDRGKVYTAQDLDDLTAVGKQFGRYLDVDGDGIPYRTIPATHPTKGSFFTRGTSHDEYARYTEDGVKNAEVLDRLLKKWDTAKEITPKPEFYQTENKSNVGVIFFGTTTYAALEAMDLLREEEGITLDAMRATAFPFHSSVEEFIAAHDQVFVIEQNRDAQFRTLLINELEVNPKKLIKILNYDGMPITAEAIRRQIAGVLATV